MDTKSKTRTVLISKFAHFIRSFDAIINEQRSNIRMKKNLVHVVHAKCSIQLAYTRTRTRVRSLASQVQVPSKLNETFSLSLFLKKYSNTFIDSFRLQSAECR